MVTRMGTTDGEISRKKTYVPLTRVNFFLSLVQQLVSPRTALGRLKDNSALIAKGLKSLSKLCRFPFLAVPRRFFLAHFVNVVDAASA